MFGVWPAARSQKSFYKAAASNMLGSFSTTLIVLVRNEHKAERDDAEQHEQAGNDG